MNLQRLFAKVQAELEKDPFEHAAELDYAQPLEVGLKHPAQSSHVLLRDDGVAEISAGSHANLQVDGTQGQITLTATSHVIAGSSVHLMAGELYFNFHRLDPLGLWNPPLVDAATWWWEHAPLVQAAPGTLATSFLTGTPQAGQTLVSFSKLFKAKPLFGPDEQLKILTENLADLLRGLTHFDG